MVFNVSYDSTSNNRGQTGTNKRIIIETSRFVYMLTNFKSVPKWMEMGYKIIKLGRFYFYKGSK